MLVTKKTEGDMCYITERVTNIAELEKIIMGCYILAQRLQKESPHSKDLQDLAADLKAAYEFEFCVERRKTIYCE